MMFLIQIYNMLDNSDKKLFIDLFSDLDYELNEMGWKDDPETLINDMLFNHFSIDFDIMDKVAANQLKMVTNAILDGRINRLKLLGDLIRWKKEVQLFI